MAKRFIYYTPEGSFKTLIDAAKANKCKPETVIKYCKRKWGRSKDDKQWYRNRQYSYKNNRIRLHQLPERLKQKRKQYNNENQKKYYNKYIRKPYRKQLSKETIEKFRIQTRENSRKFWDNITPEDKKLFISKRVKTLKDNNKKKYDNLSQFQKDKRKRDKKQLQLLYAKRYRKRNRNKNKALRKHLRKEKNKRLNGIKIYINQEKNLFNLYHKGYWKYSTNCLVCGNLITNATQGPNKIRKYCSPECRCQLSGNMEYYARELHGLIADGFSISDCATKLNVSLKYMYDIRWMLGISTPRRDFKSWTDTKGNLKSTPSILRDDNPETGEKYLPDEIESQMDDLDAWFGSL